MAKIKVHNILHTPGQVLFTFLLEASKADFLSSILYALREEGTSIPFIVQSINSDGNLILSLLADGQKKDWVRAAFQEGLDLPSSNPPRISDDVVLITLYGPHLGEIPGIANRMIASLAADGVEVLALSASINSALLVVPRELLPKSLRSLDRVFEIPPK